MIANALRHVSSALRCEEGQAFVEYSLVGALVVLAVVTAITLFVGEVGSVVGDIGHQLG